MTTPLPIRLEGDAERVRRSHHDAITELQRLPLVAARIVNDVALADGVTALVPHGLGRTPKLVLVSPPRGPSTSGRIEEIRDGINRSLYVALKASGYGATVTVDVEIK